MSSDPRVTYIEFNCGCRLEMTFERPVKAFGCEHGTEIRGRDAPTGQEILAYQRWLRTDDAREYFASLSDWSSSDLGDQP